MIRNPISCAPNSATRVAATGTLLCVPRWRAGVPVWRQSPHSPSHVYFAIAVLAALASPCSLALVQAQEVAAPSSSASQERIRVALQQRPPSPLIVGPMVPIPPDGRRFGILTFLPPDTRGQFVRVGVPIGALGSGVAHSMAATQHRHAERAAREDVARALEEFRKGQTR